MKLRSHLYLLVAGALTPTVVFALVAALLLLQHEREIMERDAIGHARAAMRAVDGHLRGSIASLETLASSTEDWAIVLVDREKRVIARIPAAPAGTPAPDDFRDAIGRSPEGWFQGRAPEGRPIYTSYVTSQLSGWALGIAIPASDAEAGARRVFATLAAGLVSALVFGGVLSWLIARRISE